MALSKNQIRFLLAKCHGLKPVVLMGQKGLTEELLNELDHALNDHELVKIKLSADDKKARVQLVSEICDRSNSEEIQTIGKMLSVYRANPEKPVIHLPKD